MGFSLFLSSISPRPFAHTFIFSFLLYMLFSSFLSIILSYVIIVSFVIIPTAPAFFSILIEALFVRISLVIVQADFGLL